MGSPAYFGKLAAMQAMLRKPLLVPVGLFNAADNLSFIPDVSITVGAIQNPALASGFSNRSGFNAVGYSTEEEGAVVRLMGTVNCPSSVSTQTAVFTILPAWRPQKFVCYDTSGLNSSTTIQIQIDPTTGIVYIVPHGTILVDSVSFEGITYRIPVQTSTGAIPTSQLTQATAPYTASLVIDTSLGDVIEVTLAGNVTSTTLNYNGSASIPSGQRLWLRLVQDVIGGRTVVLPANLIYDSGFSVDPTASRATVLPIMWDQTISSWKFFDVAFTVPTA